MAAVYSSSSSSSSSVCVCVCVCVCARARVYVCVFEEVLLTIPEECEESFLKY